MKQLNLFWPCPICEKKKYTLVDGVAITEKYFISYSLDYCPSCDLRESIKLFRKLRETLKARNHRRLQDRNYRKNRMKDDLGYRIKMNLRKRIISMTRDIRKNKQYHYISKSKSIGCSTHQLKEYIQSKFQEGMSWENYGPRGWHIDHIKPLSLFNLNDIEDFKKANHYTNLQPLWAEDNLKKSNKYEN